MNKVLDHSRVVAQHEVQVEGLGQTLKIKVLKVDAGGFMGVANLEVKGKGKAGFYRSMTIKIDEDQAYQDALNGFLAYFSEGATVREDPEW